MIDYLKKLYEEKIKPFFEEKEKSLNKISKKLRKNVSKMNFETKAMLILSIVIFIDLSLFLNKLVTYENESNVKIVKSLEDRVKKEEKKNVEKKDENSTNARLSLNNNYKFIVDSEKVYFLEGSKDGITVYAEKNATNVIKFKDIPKFSIVENLEPLLIEKEVPFYWISLPTKPVPPITGFLIKHIVIILFIGIMILFLVQTGDLSIGSKGFEKVMPKDIKGSMKDIIGYEDIKEEVVQLKELLKKRKKYKLYGIEDVFNILLTGKPGTGKSKIAGYICKTLNVPMIVTTGNVDSKYVGSGVKHIRNVFKEASKTAMTHKSKSCIIFIDEGQGLLMRRGKHDNKWADDSANELLAHLDGVKTNKDINIIVIVASNFNENNFDIDEAMARRFKKKLHFRDPNVEERKEIIKFYLKKVKSKEKKIDIDFIAKNTSGLTPAIIETIIQEAGLIALKNNEKVNTENIMKAFENVLIGQSDRKTTKDKEEMRKVIAIHEIGHFIVDFEQTLEKNGFDLEKTKEEIKLLKISSEAISRSNALGYVLSEQEDMLLKSVDSLEDEIRSLYGGVAAEEIFYGKTGITTGSSDDINKVTAILNHLVFETGSYVSYKLNLSDIEVSSDESEDLIKEKSIELYEDSVRIVKKHKELVEILSNVLLDKWVLNKDEIFEEIFLYFEARKSDEF